MIEKEVNKLETLVSELEDENTDLDKSVALYAEALKTANKILKKCNSYEKKISVIEEKEGTILETKVEI